MWLCRKTKKTTTWKINYRLLVTQRSQTLYKMTVKEMARERKCTAAPINAKWCETTKQTTLSLNSSPRYHRSGRVGASWRHIRCRARCSRSRSRPLPPLRRWWSWAPRRSPARTPAATRSPCVLGSCCPRTGSESRGSSGAPRPSGGHRILQGGWEGGRRELFCLS